MKKSKKTVIALAMLCSSTFSLSAFAGFPVLIDADIPAQINQVINHAQDIKNYAQLLKNWTQLKNQYEQQLRMYAAQTGNAMLGNIFNDPQLHNFLPLNWEQTFKDLNNQGLAALSPTANQALQQFGLTTSPVLSQVQRINYQARIGSIAQSQTDSQQAYVKSQKRTQQIQGLMNQINKTQNPKEIAEVNARIAAENGLIQNEANKLKLAQQIQARNTALLEYQAAQQANAIFNSRKYSNPTPNITIQF